MTAPLIERLTGPPDRLGALIVESEQQGLRFVRRLVDDWASRANRSTSPARTVRRPERVAKALGIGTSTLRRREGTVYPLAAGVGPR